jgi:hypothetical protein
MLDKHFGKLKESSKKRRKYAENQNTDGNK